MVSWIRANMLTLMMPSKLISSLESKGSVLVFTNTQAAELATMFAFATYPESAKLSLHIHINQ